MTAQHNNEFADRKRCVQSKHEPKIPRLLVGFEIIPGCQTCQAPKVPLLAAANAAAIFWSMPAPACTLVLIMPSHIRYVSH